jgi:hypothetical protein
MNIHRYLSTSAAIAFLVIVPVAMAQQGTTTGLATSSDVAPSTAIQKQDPAIPPHQPKAADDSRGAYQWAGPWVRVHLAHPPSRAPKEDQLRSRALPRLSDTVKGPSLACL